MGGGRERKKNMLIMHNFQAQTVHHPFLCFAKTLRKNFFLLFSQTRFLSFHLVLLPGAFWKWNYFFCEKVENPYLNTERSVEQRVFWKSIFQSRIQMDGVGIESAEFVGWTVID